MNTNEFCKPLKTTARKIWRRLLVPIHGTRRLIHRYRTRCIVVTLMGGLGNQLFQYAAGRMLSIRTGKPLVLDLGFLSNQKSADEFTPREYSLDVFSMSPTLVESFERTEHFKVVQEADNQHLIPELLTPTRDLFSIHLCGYFQKAAYVEAIGRQLRKDLVFHHKYEPEAKLLSDRIKGACSICVHIRRTDYISNQAAFNFHGFVGEEHVQAGYEKMSQLFPEASYFVFSDDINWCHSNLKFLPNATFVPAALSGVKSSQHLRLMSECKHFIIPNSTFSWWAAWLSSNPAKKVLYPKQWFRSEQLDTSGMFPTGWEAIHPKG